MSSLLNLGCLRNPALFSRDITALESAIDMIPSLEAELRGLEQLTNDATTIGAVSSTVKTHGINPSVESLCAAVLSLSPAYKTGKASKESVANELKVSQEGVIDSVLKGIRAMLLKIKEFFLRLFTGLRTVDETIDKLTAQAKAQTSDVYLGQIVHGWNKNDFYHRIQKTTAMTEHLNSIITSFTAGRVPDDGELTALAALLKDFGYTVNGKEATSPTSDGSTRGTIKALGFDRGTIVAAGAMVKKMTFDSKALGKNFDKMEEKFRTSNFGESMAGAMDAMTLINKCVVEAGKNATLLGRQEANMLHSAAGLTANT